MEIKPLATGRWLWSMEALRWWERGYGCVFFVSTANLYNGLIRCQKVGYITFHLGGLWNPEILALSLSVFYWRVTEYHLHVRKHIKWGWLWLKYFNYFFSPHTEQADFSEFSLDLSERRLNLSCQVLLKKGGWPCQQHWGRNY